MKWWQICLIVCVVVAESPAATLPRFLTDYYGWENFDCADLIQRGETVYPSDVSHPLFPGITWRTLGEIEEHLGPPFVSYESTLPPSSRIFMSGDGNSVGGLQLAQKGFRITASNIANLYGDRFARLKDRTALRTVFRALVNQEGQEFGQVAYEPVELLNRLAFIFNLKVHGIESTQLLEGYPSTGDTWKLAPGVNPDLFFDSIVQLAGDVERKIGKLAASGNFDYQADLTQEILAKTPDGFFRLAVDLLGAFPYSMPRHTLLKEFRRTLAPGALGFVVDRGTDVVELTRSYSLAKFSDIIAKNGGDRRVYLRDYLQRLSNGAYQSYDHFFLAQRGDIHKRLVQGQRVEVKVIVVRGRAGQDSSNIVDDLVLIPEPLTVSIGNGMSYPIGQYVEKNK